MLGNYPDIDSHDEKQLYALSEIDFGKRLVAKFLFTPKSFWTRGGQFQAIGKRALYPSSTNDPLLRVTQAVKEQLTDW